MAEMSVSELRKAIMGQQEFVFQLEGGAEVTMKELCQKDVNDITIELEKRGLTFGTPSYEDMKKILKLSHALKEFKMKIGDTSEIIDIKDGVSGKEKFLNELNEGMILGLHLQYESIIATKFSNIKKELKESAISRLWWRICKEFQIFPWEDRFIKATDSGLQWIQLNMVIDNEIEKKYMDSIGKDTTTQEIKASDFDDNGGEEMTTDELKQIALERIANIKK